MNKEIINSIFCTHNFKSWKNLSTEEMKNYGKKWKNYLYKGHIDEKLLRLLLDFLPFL